MQKIERTELEKSASLVAGGAAKIQTGGNMQTGDISVGDISVPPSASADASATVIISMG